MRIWDIKVLLLGKITMPFSTYMAVHYAFGAPKITENFDISGPYMGFLLVSGDRQIVVDNGISSKFIVNGKAWGGLPAEGGETYLQKALATYGITPEQVQTVLYTHLHNDHAGNCSVFKNATHVFQKDEWQNLLDPLPVQNVRKDYDQAIIPELNSLKCLKINGDIEIEDGITLYKTPGHTRGSQSIAVNTVKGTIVLVGDMLTSYISAFPGTTEITGIDGTVYSVPPAPEVFGNAIPSNVTYDFYSFYDSVSKVQAIASCNEPGYIIPGHETSLVLTGI